MSRPFHLLHVFSSFNLGGLEARACAVINSLGDAFRHTITSTAGTFGAAERIAPGVKFEIVPPPSGKGGLLYALRLGSMIAATRPDLLLTYNWGSFDAVIGAALKGACPLIHSEDGFNPDEIMGLKQRRVWARRIFLNRARAVVVPSRTLENLARNTYKLRPEIVHRIPNGIDTTKYGPAERARWRERWGFAEDDFVIGCVGRLSPEKNLNLLLRAVARCREANARLVLVGSGSCQEELERVAKDLDLAGRVIFSGFVPDPSGCYGAFDLFAMSSSTEQMPMSLLEAMAAGLPAVCTSVGDTAEILASPGEPVTVPAADLDAYAKALDVLCRDAELRQRLGQANRKRCREVYSLAQMTGRYRQLYLRAMEQKK
jgi:glycosyltransferase involved in cell wall biosynthesis